MYKSETYATDSERGNLEINAEVIEGSHPIRSTTPCFYVCVLMHFLNHKFDVKFLDKGVFVSDGKICFHELFLSNCFKNSKLFQLSHIGTFYFHSFFFQLSFIIKAVCLYLHV